MWSVKEKEYGHWTTAHVMAKCRYGSLININPSDTSKLQVAMLHSD